MKPLPGFVPGLQSACREAGRAILAARASAEPAERKPDGTPVGAADRAASAILAARLAALDPQAPVVCEEGNHDAGTAPAFWLVDPLDGTREFLAGRELFTVNVARIESGRPVFGMIHAPVGGSTWWGGAGLGAWRDGIPLRGTRLDAAAARVLLSPGEPRAGGWVGRLLADFGAARADTLPGALKFCRLAEGAADIYPRAQPCNGWDSAAGQAIVEGAGGAVLGLDGRALAYPSGPGWGNPAFLAVADSTVDWPGRLRAWCAGGPEDACS